MHLSQLDREGKPQRACTPESHAAIKKSLALFRTLTSALGYQYCRAGDDKPDDPEDDGARVLELGLCRNCGSTLARVLTPGEVTLWEIETELAGDAR